ncbi:putative spermidine/putrescine transport system permease protein [Nocardioides albertanoniae]|uniref:Putative spermidine/putrescine transport system permease protein n=1 Tax=Nocardioides albertanoniae TaxID=1175486 RepID=A0A543A5L2_9ACTN|nr:ABC transporter permease [Nocardioides albertanoniae]TQL67883.1 putative spermidine/putrescine transport system permease protein [Nocardioides albertanoniae]
MTTTSSVPDARRGRATDPSRGPVARPASRLLHRRARLRLALLLSAPLTWLVLVYVVALAALLITSLWSVDSLTSEIDRTWTLDNFRTLVENEIYRTVAVRTVGVALAVTVIDVVIALPIAFYMAKVATPRVRRMLVVAVLTPLWASYLVKVFSWRVVLSEGGLADWTGIGSPGYGIAAVIIAQSYIWLPYVILPVFAALERVPDSLLEAAGDLGAPSRMVVRTIVLPLLVPGIVAGAIFSFSLTMGDYITVNIVGGASQMLGNLIYINAGAANNLPLAAAIAMIPIIVMVVLLTAIRRTGALDNL